jgi:hypothetical protein
MKAEGHLGRCYLKGREGDASNAILTAVGYDLRPRLAENFVAILPACITASSCHRTRAQIGLLTADYSMPAQMPSEQKRLQPARLGRSVQCDLRPFSESPSLRR